MAIWYVHRRGGSIVSAHQDAQPGYAEEALDDAQNPEMAAYMSRAGANGDAYRSLVLRRAAELEASADIAKQIEGLRLRLSLVGV